MAAAALRTVKDEVYDVVKPGQAYPEKRANKRAGSKNMTSHPQIFCKRCFNIYDQRFALAHISHDGFHKHGVDLCRNMPKKHIEALAKFPQTYPNAVVQLFVQYGCFVPEKQAQRRLALRQGTEAHSTAIAVARDEAMASDEEQKLEVLSSASDDSSTLYGEGFHSEDEDDDSDDIPQGRAPILLPLRAIGWAHKLKESAHDPPPASKLKREMESASEELGRATRAHARLSDLFRHQLLADLKRAEGRPAAAEAA
jgi:hypothetical protein